MPFLLLVAVISGLTSYYFVIESRRTGPYTAIRLAYLYTLLTISVLVFVYNEALSPINEITPQTAIGFWSFCLLLAGWLLFGVWRDIKDMVANGNVGSLWRLTGLPVGQKVIIVVCLLFLGLPLLFLAAYSPPNNFDSHNYHLNRILFWLSNQNLDHFPTTHIQQLYHNVFAEYIVLHSFLLGGSDQFANLIQFGAMVGSVVGVSLLAKQFGLSQWGQFLSAVLMFTLPIGLFESTTTQNDYVACFFFVCFVLFGYRCLQIPAPPNLFFCLLSLAFGGFTKYTILIYALPFVVYVGIRLLSQYGVLYGLKTLLLSLGLFGFIFAPFFVRNHQLFGHILGPREESRLFVEKIPADKFSVVYTLSGIAKNAGLHLGIPYSGYNTRVDAAIKQLHGLLGVALDDPGLSLDSYYTRFSMAEDMAPNTLHFLLLMVAMGLLLTRRGNKDIKILIGLTLVGMVLFSTIFKFQLWSSRTHMPFFAVGALITAFACERLMPRKAIYLSALLLIVSSIVVYGNPGKTLLPLRFIGKKATGYIPRDLCPTNARQATLYKQLLSAYYDPEKGGGCYPLRHSFTFAERSVIFDKLDSIGYFEHDKQSSVFTQPRAGAYFNNHPGDYAHFRRLLPRFQNDVTNVGILFAGTVGFYHYWTVLQEQQPTPVSMAYIRYKREFMKLPNAKKPFCYNYVLSDNLSLVRQTFLATEIDAIYATEALIVVKLKKESCKTYLF